MVPPRLTARARPTVDYGQSYSEYDPYDLPDEGDWRQGAASERPNKKIIILLDMDCYEVQDWIKDKCPEFENQDVPMVVVNFDMIILAVNNTARLLGIESGNGRSYLEEMEQKHPKLVIIKTGELFGKTDCFTSPERSDDIFKILLDYQKTLDDPNLITIERSSEDEVYIDVTNLVRLRTKPARSKQVLRLPPHSTINQLTSATKTHPNSNYNGRLKVVMAGRRANIYGSNLKYRILVVYRKRVAAYHADETRLAHGALIALELIKLIKEQTGLDSSAGVAHNKLLAKLACNENKPQGITIFTHMSIPRVSKNLEFKRIPGYGGKIGDDLLGYFSQKGQDVTTLDDILTLPMDDLIAAFWAVGSSDAESDAVALIDKCRGNDDSVLTKRHFPETINASGNFRGTNFVRHWDDFKDRVFNLSRDIAHRIKYSIERWNRQPQSLVVEATMRKGSIITPSGVNNRRRIDGLIDAIAIYAFIMQYLEANSLEFGDIEGIKATAADFQRSSEDKVATVLGAAKDCAMQSAPEGTGSRASKYEAELNALASKLDSL